MKNSVVGFCLLLAMMFQNIVLAMPCCIDMQADVGHAQHQMVLAGEKAVGNQHAHCQSMADDVEDVPFVQYDDPVSAVDQDSHHCPMMDVLPGSTVGLPDQPSLLKAVEAEPILNSFLPTWVHSSHASRLERPPKV